MHPAFEVELERILMKVIDMSDFHPAVEAELLRAADAIIYASAEEDYRAFLDNKDALRLKYPAFEPEMMRIIKEVIDACGFPPELETEIESKAWAILNDNEDLKDNGATYDGREGV